MTVVLIGLGLAIWLIVCIAVVALCRVAGPEDSLPLEVKVDPVPIPIGFGALRSMSER